MHSNFEITKPLDNKITQKLVDEQNSVCKQIEDDTKPIKIIRGVPGTGKSVIIIARMLRTKNTAIFVKDTEQLSNFFTENQRLRWTSNPNDTTLAPFVGKGSTDPVMCPERKLQYPNKVKIPISAHKFCDGYKKNCPFYNEIYEDTPNGRKVKDRATEKISRLLKDINSYYPNHESMQLKDVVNFIASWGYCPYYFFREMVKIADNVLCDYYHFIQPQVIKSLGPFHNASIDEDLIFDSLTKYMSAKIETDEIEKSLKKLEKKEILFYNEISIPMLHKTINFLKRKGEIVRKLKEKAEEINLKQEIASDKELREAYYLFKTIYDKNSADIGEYIQEHRNGFRSVLKLFRNIDKFADGYSFVEYIEGEEKNTILERRAEIFDKFFENRKRTFNSIDFYSATYPPKEILDMHLNKDDIKHISIEHEITGREGILLVNEEGNLSYNEIKNSNESKLRKKVDLLINTVKASPRNEIVVAPCSNRILRNKTIKNLLEQGFKKAGIPIFELITNVDKQKEQWSSYHRSCKKKKSVMLVSANTKWATGTNELSDDGCRVLIMWGIPYPYKKKAIVKKIWTKILSNPRILKGTPPEKKYDVYMNVLKVRNRYIQIIGRLIRNSIDYGFFIIIANKKINKILSKDIREDLGLYHTSTIVEEVKTKMGTFFKERI